MYQVYWVGIISLMLYRFDNTYNIDMWESKRGQKQRVDRRNDDKRDKSWAKALLIEIKEIEKVREKEKVREVELPHLTIHILNLL